MYARFIADFAGASMGLPLKGELFATKPSHINQLGWPQESENIHITILTILSTRKLLHASIAELAEGLPRDRSHCCHCASSPFGRVEHAQTRSKVRFWAEQVVSSLKA